MLICTNELFDSDLATKDFSEQDIEDLKKRGTWHIVLRDKPVFFDTEVKDKVCIFHGIRYYVMNYTKSVTNDEYTKALFAMFNSDRFVITTEHVQFLVNHEWYTTNIKIDLKVDKTNE